MLTHLRKVGASSPDEIARALGTTSANVRHHLSVMIKNGLIEKVGARKGKGRPVMIYGLSRLAAGDNLSALAHALLDQPAPDPEQRTRDIALRLSGDPITAPMHITRRLTLVVDRLNAMNYHARWEAGSSGPRIILSHCPYAPIVKSHPELCRMDSFLLRELLGMTAEQIAKLEPNERGLPVCVFVAR
jgi:predicted ArsR family transcriptional regulator